MKNVFVRTLVVGMLGLFSLAVVAEDVYPTAILAFAERGKDVKGMGAQVRDLLFVGLVENPQLMLVDREDLQKSMEEAELSLSGAVKADEVIQIGHLTGAKIIITGSVMQVGKKLYLVGKIIGTETSRVLGASAKGDAAEDLDVLVEQLVEKLGAKIAADAGKLVAKPVKHEDLIATLNKKLGKAKRPSVRITVVERHVGQVTIDPAAETELTLFCTETGFQVLNADASSREKADIVMTGEGFSEFAMRRGNLVSVKARLEVKAVDRKTGRIIAVDRQTSVVVDLTEQIAGKKALQAAAERIALRMLPKLVR